MLERANIIDRSRLRATIDLTWPRVITGFARTSQQTVDLAMVGLMLGPSAIAGLAFAYAYWQIGNKISAGLSGGTISLVSQHYGAGRSEKADRVITQSYLVATILALPLTVLFFFQAELLIGMVGATPDAIEYGATYLTFLGPALVFEFYNKIASRVFAGIGDTFTPMLIRAGGAVVNIVLNAVLIFGLGLGVVGAAIGTLVATALVAAVFIWGLFFRTYPMRDPIPVGFTIRGLHADPVQVRSLLTISTPLIFQQLSKAIVVFPLLSIAAVFGSAAVAAYEIGRRVRDLINSLSWGFSIASSSLVGRHLGADEETIATTYGSEIIRFSVVSFVLLATVVIIFARPIATLFVSDLETITLTVSFIRVAAIASVALGVDSAATGALRGAGDTRWPFLGTIVGLYVFTLPIAYLSVVTPYGILTLYLALFVETFVPAVITTHRFRSGAWRGVSQTFRQRSSQ